mmetsp:Transcript_20153/g.36586  ORF Transcript_20153/g.36586 Transcript_20153/m.36586 type:complete len:347 (+) Transcript_20153:51-1091(+)
MCTMQRSIVMKVLISVMLWNLVSAFTLITTPGKKAETAFTRNAVSLLSSAPTIIPAPTPVSKRNIVVVSHNVSNDIAAGLFDDRNLLHGRVDVLARCVNSGLWLSNDIRDDTSVFLMFFPQNRTIEVVGRSVSDLNPDERTTALCLQRTLLIASAKNNHGGGNDQSFDQHQEEELLKIEKGYNNPNKPGSLPKSLKKALRIKRKAREAMLRRINRAGLQDVAPPCGFIYHENETLAGRLDKIKEAAAAAAGSVDSNDDDDSSYTVTRTYMLVEDGEPFGERLSLAAGASRTTDVASIFVLGDQNGYTECDEEMLRGRNDVDRVSIGSISLLTSQCITICHHYLDAL